MDSRFDYALENRFDWDRVDYRLDSFEAFQKIHRGFDDTAMWVLEQVYSGVKPKELRQRTKKRLKDLPKIDHGLTQISCVPYELPA